MRPLNEWDELSPDRRIFGECLDELLRRERGRCASLCEEYAKWEEGIREDAALACAKRIRELQ